MSESGDRRASAAVLRSDALAGTTALVTGAGTGIGRVVSRRLVELSADVIGFGRRTETLQGTADRCAAGPGGFTWHSVDVRDTDMVTELVVSLTEPTGLDLLVNNAGGQFVSPAADLSPRGWRAVVDLNLDAVFHVTRAAFPALRRRAGAVVNLSLSGLERGSAGIAHSVAARAGVLGLTRTLVHEWSPYGIRLNCLGPGLVRTGALDDPDYAAALDAGTQDIPLGRETDVWEVAEFVAFLATPAAQLITGQLLQIDGGAHLGAGLHMIGLDTPGGS